MVGSRPAVIVETWKAPKLEGQAEVGSGAAVRMQAPQIDCQLSGHCDDFFLPLRFCGFGSTAEGGKSFLHRTIDRLEPDHAPL